jgi:Na+/proline symporter
MDVLQWSIYILAGLAALAVALHLAPGGLAEASAAGKLRVIDPTFSLTRPYALGTAIVGGAFLSAASHGTDHLIVQRLLATRSLSDARAALVGSGLVVMAEFALFLLVGVAIWAADPTSRSAAGDAVFPTFAATHLPTGLGGLVVAGILAAAMGSTASALNSLASATTHDYYAPITGRAPDDPGLLRAGRLFTLLWAALLMGGALLFRRREAPVVVIALSIASLTYGALLGTFILARVRRVQGPHVIAAIVGSTVLMAFVVFAGPLRDVIAPMSGWGPYGDGAALANFALRALGQIGNALEPLAKLAWPWYVPLGTALTVGIALAASLVLQQRRAAAESTQG